MHFSNIHKNTGWSNSLMYAIKQKKRKEKKLISLICIYFHSQVFSVKFPSASITASKTPIRLLRDASLPVDDVLKNNEPHQFIFFEESILPIPSPVTVASSDSPAIIAPIPLP
jgi:hypothetical protein